jgi:L-2-hydroxyglutarate oxidase
LALLLQQAGGQVYTGSCVERIVRDASSFVVETTAGTFGARAIINCAGLHSDRVTACSGERPAVRIVPFRGEYYELKPAAFHLCRNLIYPVPDPQFPFLGVHFTRMIQGGVECGPNAVFALAREGYSRTSLNLRDTWDSLSYFGFVKLAARYWRMGMGEMYRSFSKSAFVRALQRLVPEITADDLVDGRAGIRAQAVGRDGSLVDDFLIQQHGPLINVANAPSPAATSALNIGHLIADKLAQTLD